MTGNLENFLVFVYIYDNRERERQYMELDATVVGSRKMKQLIKANKAAVLYSSSRDASDGERKKGTRRAVVW